MGMIQVRCTNCGQMQETPDYKDQVVCCACGGEFDAEKGRKAAEKYNLQKAIEKGEEELSKLKVELSDRQVELRRELHTFDEETDRKFRRLKEEEKQNGWKTLLILVGILIGLGLAEIGLLNLPGFNDFPEGLQYFLLGVFFVIIIIMIILAPITWGVFKDVAAGRSSSGSVSNYLLQRGNTRKYMVDQAGIEELERRIQEVERTISANKRKLSQ